MGTSIQENIKKLLEDIPAGVVLVAAAKTRMPDEILIAVKSGVRVIGENYVQEGEKAREAIGDIVEWHFIGHLQKNKVKKAVRIFDVIETVDSLELASEINKRCAEISKVMPVFVEVNSGDEEQKAGVAPKEVESFVTQISGMKNIKVTGLMTMGPLSDDPEAARPYFNVTKEIFCRIKDANVPNVEMKFLSMGMTSSYKVAIEEGANMIRVGTKIFGERTYNK